MAIIVQTIVGDNQLQLRNEELLRQMKFGTDWRAVTIGMRWSSLIAGNIASPVLTLGVNSGTAFGVKSNNTVEYMGARLGGASVDWTYVAGAPSYFSARFYNYIYRVGSTSTVDSNNSGTVYGGIMPIRSLFFVTIAKRTAAGQLQIVSSSPGSTALVQADATVDSLYRGIESEAALTGFGGGYANTGNITYNGNYTFDSVSVSWSDNTWPVNISDLVVARHY